MGRDLGALVDLSEVVECASRLVSRLLRCLELSVHLMSVTVHLLIQRSAVSTVPYSTVCGSC